ncbi:Suf-domain-containing protein [Rhodofomes roseus]|uniref:mRNA 3'-end-processing protein RNA14 n=1 Tax=Rhodofomes roseus TaxID=34475 RepID=A0ABQ8KWJ0_9APHY|nr:Suf-domain-containing protein [Rhodofomes roseus]KAH9843581.1 Suf-domain-containing protein [Rhodofomes roseus]
MSEAMVVDPPDSGETSFLGEQDKTQPTDDILNALRQLNPNSFPHPQNGGANVQSPIKQELTPSPPSEWEQLRAQLREKPHDADGWLRLVDLAEDSGDMERIKETYEGLLEAYPNTSSAQIAYLNHYTDNPETFGSAVTLFKRYLTKSSSVDLWKFYLTFVRRVNTGPNSRDIIRTAYEFALGHVGQDKDSGEMWSDYIQFLKAGETTSTWEEQQKMDAVRKAYQRAVQIPMDNIKRLWEEYQDFENGLNRITAKKFLSDLQESHMQARTVLTTLQEHLNILFPPPPPSKSARPPIWLPRPPAFNAGDRALVGRWRQYLKWEESNPLKLDDKDKGNLHARLQGVYKKAVVRMRFFSEIWYMAYVWTNNIGKIDEAVALLKAGIEANPSSFVLNFAYAEAQEMAKNYAEVHATFEKFLEVLKTDLDAVEIRINSANSSFSSNISQSQKTEPADNSQPDPGSQSQGGSFTTEKADEKPPKNKELSERRTEYGIAWVSYMRFARRAEGLKPSRAIFGKARKERWTPWEVYEAAAIMEYHCNKAADVANRIFEKGMESFSDEVEFVLRYLGFLISINDENNARALFERVIGTFPPEKARPLWERWSKYEYQYGDLEAAHKLEKRMAEAYPNDPPIKRFAERYKYLGTDAIANRDLGFSLSRQGNGRSNGSATLGRTDTQMSLVSNPPSQPQATPSSSKRPSSPESHGRRRDDSRAPDYGPPSKRQRAVSRDRDRDRWDGPPRRRHGSPGWDRERERDGPGRRSMREEREEEKQVTLPPVLSWFAGMLPAPSSFDGPVFRTDDLMQVFRNAVIPSSSSVTTGRSPPPPPRGGGRPPPDYGPYQGPGGGRRGRY